MNSPLALAGQIAPRSPWRVAEVKALPGFQLRVAFADGLTGLGDLSGVVHSQQAGVFAAPAAPSRFEQVRLDYGAVA